MLIPLKAWAEQQFRPAPTLSTLRAWAKCGLISPAPQKVGRQWMVDERAVYSRPEPSDNPDLSARARAILRIAS